MIYHVDDIALRFFSMPLITLLIYAFAFDISPLLIFAFMLFRQRCL